MTTSHGNQLLECLKSTREFFQQVGSLLRAIDVLLEDAGWVIQSTNTCCDITSHFRYPARWMPRNLYRYYRPNGHPRDDQHRLFMFSVLLDQPESDSLLKEPWATAAIFCFASEEDVDGFKWWKEWATEFVEEGQLHVGELIKWELDPESVPTESDDNLVSRVMLGVPLVEITDQDVLRDRLISPLLRFDQTPTNKEDGPVST